LLLFDVDAKIQTILREKKMSDLKKYIALRKRTDKEFAEGFEKGCEQFKIGVILGQARKSAGLT
jgi:hypothetical protein